MLPKHEIKGVVVPLITPFTENGEVYEEGLKHLLDFHVEKGVHGIFPCGTYGSGPLMTTEQRKKVIEITVNHLKGRIAVIAQVGAASTDETVKLAKHAEKVGVDVVAVVPPYYYSYDEVAILEHYKQIVKAVRIPVYAYNIPRASGFTITPSILAKMADFGVQGIKDSSFSLVDFMHFIIELGKRENFTFMVGTEALLLPAMMVGSKGCVSGTANVFPELIVQLYNAITERNYDEAVKIQLKAVEARRILISAKSTTAICHRLLKERKIDVGVPKRPILPATDEELNFAFKGFSRLGLL
ncbi:dihydrodipicolinate synthase family protein [Candidatus Bathyarchaeota archaeon]|nr:dihydrodipicolinate synthase family protein [Candidatus Bathyarchaeota archaeon]